MLDGVVPAPLEDVQETENVAVGVGVGVLQRVADACLRREVDDLMRTQLGEERAHAVDVGDVDAAETEPAVLLQLLEARFLQRDVVVVIDVVDSDDLVAAGEQPRGDVVADESGRAGDEDQHLSPFVGCGTRAAGCGSPGRNRQPATRNPSRAGRAPPPSVSKPTDSGGTGIPVSITAGAAAMRSSRSARVLRP